MFRHWVPISIGMTMVKWRTYITMRQSIRKAQKQQAPTVILTKVRISNLNSQDFVVKQSGSCRVELIRPQGRQQASRQWEKRQITPRAVAYLNTICRLSRTPIVMPSSYRHSRDFLSFSRTREPIQPVTHSYSCTQNNTANTKNTE